MPPIWTSRNSFKASGAAISVQTKYFFGVWSLYFYKWDFILIFNLLIESLWSSQRAPWANSRLTKLLPRRLLTNSTPSMLPMSRLSDKKCNPPLHRELMFKDPLKNHTYILSTTNITPSTPQLWNGLRPWAKFQVLNKYRPITSTSALPEDMPLLSGVAFCFLDLWDKLRIFSCSLNLQLKLGALCLPIFISTLKERNTSWCLCSQDFIQKSQLWSW